MARRGGASRRSDGDVTEVVTKMVTEIVTEVVTEVALVTEGPPEGATEVHGTCSAEVMVNHLQRYQ